MSVVVSVSHWFKLKDLQENRKNTAKLLKENFEFVGLIDEQ